MNNEILRCDREIAEALKQFSAPAWLVTLGVEDWEAEKRLIVLDAARESNPPTLEV